MKFKQFNLPLVILLIMIIEKSIDVYIKWESWMFIFGHYMVGNIKNCTYY